MEERYLIMILIREHLKDKVTCMIVFDEVWKFEFWRNVEYALLDNNKNNEVSLMTQNNIVV